jgi:hypothetical protein
MLPLIQHLLSPAVQGDIRFITCHESISLFWVPYGVNKLAALSRALITLGSPSTQLAHLSCMSSP